MALDGEGGNDLIAGVMRCVKCVGCVKMREVWGRGRRGMRRIAEALGVFGIFGALGVLRVLCAEDISAHLERNDSALWAYYQQVQKQSILRDYPRFRGQILIDQKTYQNLSKEEKKSFANQVVLVALYLEGEISYSEFGGVSAQGILAEEREDRRARRHYYLFDGRYYRDLLAVQKERRVYAYCKLPRFENCILLGVGEEW